MNGINYNLLRCFDEKLTYDDVWDDIVEKYKITNLDINYEDGENVDFLVNQLLGYYNDHIYNYRSFISEDINARIFMEIANNAQLIFEEEVMKRFCEEHKYCESLKGIIALRTKYIKKFLPGYKEYDFLFAVVISKIWGISIDNVYLDFETIYLDRTREYQRTPENYKYDFDQYMKAGFKSHFKYFESLEVDEKYMKMHEDDVCLYNKNEDRYKE